MKRNLLTVLILALLIVNLGLTGVMAFNVLSTNKKTAELVGNIATVLNFELSTPGSEEASGEVSLADTDIHNIIGSRTIPRAVDGSGRQSYIVFEVSLYLNKTSDGYAEYGETISNWESVIKEEITNVVIHKTEFECKNDVEGLKADILKALQNKFHSDFIYSIGLSGFKFG